LTELKVVEFYLWPLGM